MFAIEYLVHIWQVSLQLSCGDTCQLWMRFKECNRYFCKIEHFAYGEIDKRSFSNLHPWPVYEEGIQYSSTHSLIQPPHCDGNWFHDKHIFLTYFKRQCLNTQKFTKWGMTQVAQNWFFIYGNLACQFAPRKGPRASLKNDRKNLKKFDKCFYAQSYHNRPGEQWYKKV